MHHVGVPLHELIAMRRIIRGAMPWHLLEKSYYPSTPGIFLGLVGVEISVTARAV